VDDNPLAPKPPVGVTRGLIRHRDKAHVGSIWLNRDTDDEFEDPATGQRRRWRGEVARRSVHLGAGAGDPRRAESLRAS